MTMDNDLAVPREFGNATTQLVEGNVNGARDGSIATFGVTSDIEHQRSGGIKGCDLIP